MSNLAVVSAAQSAPWQVSDSILLGALIVSAVHTTVVLFMLTWSIRSSRRDRHLTMEAFMSDHIVRPVSARHDEKERRGHVQVSNNGPSMIHVQAGVNGEAAHVDAGSDIILAIRFLPNEPQHIFVYDLRRLLTHRYRLSFSDGEGGDASRIAVEGPRRTYLE